MNARIFFSFIVFIAFFIAPCKLNAQGYKVNIKLAFWADTTIWNGFNPIIQTYKNYLESYPDSDYNNPYWNESEKQHYKKFDFSKTALFQKGGWCTAKYVFKEYNVVILNIEQKDSVSFLIQSMLWGDSLGKKYERFNPLAMHRYYVIKEANNWKMANALFYDTKNWIVKESEFIRYHFPFASYYSDSLANLNEQFCKALMRRFKWKA
ncbi:MAG: hypothetical protein HYV28_13920 [Ignavibacteriales bacterium]|nr:hypothetical protein [Ignavibacteriales bacterium]